MILEMAHGLQGTLQQLLNMEGVMFLKACFSIVEHNVAKAAGSDNIMNVWCLEREQNRTSWQRHLLHGLR